MTEEIKRAVEEKGYEASIWITLASVSYVELSGGFDRAPELDTMESLALRNSTGGRLQYIDRDADGWVGSGDALRVWIPGTSRDGAYETYLVSLGVPKASLSTVSFGKERPLDPGHDEGAWAKNRRAHFILK